MSEMPEGVEHQVASSTAPQKQEEAWKEEIAIMLAQAERRANSLPTKRSGDGW